MAAPVPAVALGHRAAPAGQRPAAHVLQPGSAAAHGLALPALGGCAAAGHSLAAPGPQTATALPRGAAAGHGLAAAGCDPASPSRQGVEAAAAKEEPGPALPGAPEQCVPARAALVGAAAAGCSQTAQSP